MYGVTFVDNKNKCVFNGSDLGKNYSISALQNRLTPHENIKESTGNDEKIMEKNVGNPTPLIRFSNNKKQEEIALPSFKNNCILEV